MLVSFNADYLVTDQNLQRDIICTMDWFTSSLIKLNASNTKPVFFKTPLKRVELPIPVALHTSSSRPCNCKYTECAKSVKYIGIYFDSDLSCCAQLTYLCKMLKSVSCLIYSIKMFLSFSLRNMIAQALACSYLRYRGTLFMLCSLFWRARVHLLFKSILKSVTFTLSDVSSAEIF